MNGGVTASAGAVKSVLEKPLHELTEDDISQLTRDDCRRFLKDKGMRRPSWNKSQAIQQVICLKSLLEPSPPPNVAAAGFKRAFRHPLVPIASPASIHATLTVNSSSSSSAKELSPAEVDISVSAYREERGPNQLQGPLDVDSAREGDCQPTVVNSKGSSVSGKVNAYDGVPVDKAHTVMHLEASPMKFCQEEPNCETPVNWRAQCLFRSSSAMFNTTTQDTPVVQSMLTGKMSEPVYCGSEGNNFHEQDAEGQKNRQVLLQRYLEKRKDRGKFKMKRKLGSSTGLEMYLNHPMKVPLTNGQGTDGNTSTTSQPGLPLIDNGSIDKQPKNLGLSVDLNDKG